MHLNWFRFWNQYETQIGKSGVSPISKFLHLKNGLPFTTDRNKRPKVILKSKFGKSFKFSKAHTEGTHLCL